MNKNITVDMSVRMTIDVFLLVLLVSSNLIVELVLVYDGGRIKLFGFGIIAIFSIDYFYCTTLYLCRFCIYVCYIISLFNVD